MGKHTHKAGDVYRCTGIDLARVMFKTWGDDHDFCLTHIDGKVNLGDILVATGRFKPCGDKCIGEYITSDGQRIILHEFWVAKI